MPGNCVADRGKLRRRRRARTFANDRQDDGAPLCGHVGDSVGDRLVYGI
jgi:hypothetical protein